MRVCLSVGPRCSDDLKFWGLVQFVEPTLHALYAFFTRYPFCTMFWHTTLCHHQGAFVVVIGTLENGPLHDKLINSRRYTCTHSKLLEFQNLCKILGFVQVWMYVCTYTYTHLRTYSMEQNPYWEANRFSDSQKIPRILWNTMVHYRIHNCPPPASVLSQIDPVHTLTPHFLKMYLNITLQSTPGCSKWSLSLRCPHQNNVKKYIIYIIYNIQGVTGGTDQTSGECSLGHTIPI